MNLHDIIVPTLDGNTVIFRPGQAKREWTEEMKLSPKAIQLLVPYTSHIVPPVEDCCGA